MREANAPEKDRMPGPMAARILALLLCAALADDATVGAPRVRRGQTAQR